MSQKTLKARITAAAKFELPKFESMFECNVGTLKIQAKKVMLTVKARAVA